MTFIDRENVGGVDYAIQGTIPMGTCATPAGTEVKVGSFADNFGLSAGNLISVTFTYANTYGDGSTTYPKLTVNGTNYPIAYLTGEYAGDGAWANGQAVTFMFDGTKLNIVSAPKIQTTDKVQAGSTLPVTSGGVANALDTPKDAVLHYSFDDVPDYPDGTAVYRKNKDFIDIDGWRTDNPNYITISSANGLLNVVTTNGTGGAYIYKSITFSNSIVKIKLKASDTYTIAIFATGTTSGTKYFQVRKNEVIEIVTYFEGNCTAIGISAINWNSTLEIQSIYIGDGSYNTPVIDNSGNGNNGTNNGGIAVQGVSGKGAYFPSANQEVRIPVTNLPAPTSNDNITISCWLKINSDYADDTTSCRKPVVTIGSVVGSFGIYRNSSLGNIGFLNRDSTNDRTVYAPLKKDGKWHNYIGVYDGITHKSTLYEDGVLIGTTSANIANYQFGGSDTYWRVWSNYVIGGVSSGSVADQPAALDDILIFNRALSEQEVLALYLNKANTPKYYDLNNYELGKRLPLTIQPTEGVDRYFLIKNTAYTSTSGLLENRYSNQIWLHKNYGANEARKMYTSSYGFGGMKIGGNSVGSTRIGYCLLKLTGPNPWTFTPSDGGDYTVQEITEAQYLDPTTIDANISNITVYNSVADIPMIGT